MPRLATYSSGFVASGCVFIVEIAPQFSLAGNKRRVALWKCRCGKQFTANIPNVISGQVKSCGCLKRIAVLKRCSKHGNSPMAKATRVYRFWQSMKDRCHNPRSSAFKYYGGRGIACHTPWRNSFVSFLDYFKSVFELSDIPVGMSMDRINNDGDYAPGNLRIADTITQANNRRGVRLFNVGGKTVTLRQIYEATGIKPKTILARVDIQGMTIDRAIAKLP